MIFTLGKSALSIQQAINKALSRSLVFDSNVTPEQAQSDWKNVAVKCRAICGVYENNKLTTGQVQGNKDNRHYVAVGGAVNPTLPSILSTSNTTPTLSNLGLEVDHTVTSTISADSATMPKYGDGGYGIPGNTLMVYSDRSGYLHAHLSGGYANQYYHGYTDNPGGKYQTWTYTQRYSYCVMHSVVVASDSNVHSTIRAPNNSAGIVQVADKNLGPFVAFLRPAFSSATWGTYSTGVGFGNSTQQMTTSDTLAAYVTKSPYRNFPLSLPASGEADETVVPSWSAMVTYFGDRRVFIKFDIAEGADMEPVTMTPGLPAQLTVNSDSILYSAPRFIKL